MKNRWQRPLVFAIIALGIIGVVTTLIENPLGLLRTILIMVVIAIVFYFLFRIVMNKSSGKDVGAYRRAARQSAKRFKNKKPKSSSHLKLIKNRAKSKGKDFKKNNRRNAEHLKVIEGKKRKKKNRALF